MVFCIWKISDGFWPEDQKDLIKILYFPIITILYGIWYRNYVPENTRLSERVIATSVLSKTGEQFHGTEVPLTSGGTAILPVALGKENCSL